MANPDLLDIGVRKAIIDEINSENNKARKRASLKAFEIYKNRHADFVIEKLREERNDDTVRNMRKSLSLNLSGRIINELASVYKEPPVRLFQDVSDKESEQLENLYDEADANNRLAIANKYYKLCNQAALQVIPKKGKVMLRPLMPHHYDVIPDQDNPEEAYAYVLSVFDKHNFLSNTRSDEFVRRSVGEQTRPEDDAHNQKIADADDYKALEGLYIVWTDDLHFSMNQDGIIMEDAEAILNPIGRLPFIDIADEKDMEFFVREGHLVTDFAIEISADFSDVDEIFALQGYAQGIMIAEKAPENITIGPNRLLHLKLDPNRPETRPEFQFVSPSPNLDSGMTKIENKIKFFLTSMGLDPKIINTDSQRFNSGLERLLAMVEKFEASKRDVEIFRSVEKELFDIMVLWSNVFQGVPPEIGLKEDLNVASINDDAYVDIVFNKPEMIRTKSEQEDSIIKRLNEGLMSKVEAISELREIDEDAAKEVIEKIKEDQMDLVPGFALKAVSDQQQKDMEEEEDGGTEGQGAV
jgi:hypothetical protein